MLEMVAAADSASIVRKKYSVFIYSEAEPHAMYTIYKQTRTLCVLQYADRDTFRARTAYVNGIDLFRARVAWQENYPICCWGYFRLMHKKANNNENHQNQVMWVLIWKHSLSTLRWVPICQGFSDFSGFLHYFILTKLATSSIRVKTRHLHVILLGLYNGTPYQHQTVCCFTYSFQFITVCLSVFCKTKTPPQTAYAIRKFSEKSNLITLKVPYRYRYFAKLNPPLERPML